MCLQSCILRYVRSCGTRRSGPFHLQRLRRRRKDIVNAYIMSVAPWACSGGRLQQKKHVKGLIPAFLDSPRRALNVCWARRHRGNIIFTASIVLYLRVMIGENTPSHPDNYTTHSQYGISFIGIWNPHHSTCKPDYVYPWPFRTANKENPVHA